MPNAYIHSFKPNHQYFSFYPYYLPSFYGNYYPRHFNRYYQPLNLQNVTNEANQEPQEPKTQKTPICDLFNFKNFIILCLFLFIIKALLNR